MGIVDHGEGFDAIGVVEELGFQVGSYFFDELVRVVCVAGMMMMVVDGDR